MDGTDLAEKINYFLRIELGIKNKQLEDQIWALISNETGIY